MRQYPSDDCGYVPRSILNGADAILMGAVAEVFGVPLEHMECRVVHTFDSSGNDFDYEQYGGLLFGKEHFRVAAIDGKTNSFGEEVGRAVGNDVEKPIYRREDAYLRFHVKYLKDYFRRNATPSSDGSSLAPHTQTSNYEGNERTALVEYLHKHAAKYTDYFSSDAWKKADQRFIKYAAERAKELEKPL